MLLAEHHGQMVGFVFDRFLIPLCLRRLAILINVILVNVIPGFTQSLQANSGAVPYVRQHATPSFRIIPN